MKHNTIIKNCIFPHDERVVYVSSLYLELEGALISLSLDLFPDVGWPSETSCKSKIQLMGFGI